MRETRAAKTFAVKFSIYDSYKRESIVSYMPHLAPGFSDTSAVTPACCAYDAAPVGSYTQSAIQQISSDWNLAGFEFQSLEISGVRPLIRT
jgi:hypothetical protein